MNSPSAPARPSPAFATRPHGLFIDGSERPAADGGTMATVDPMTGTDLTTVAVAGQDDVDAAVAAARRAFEDPGWGAIGPEERSRVLYQIAEVIEANADELAILDSLEMGGPLALTRWMVDHTVEVYRHYAGWPTRIYGATAPSAPGQLQYTKRSPLGVVVAIAGWNGPLLQMGYKIAPALATGNTVVAKPSEQTSLSLLRMAELVSEHTDLPDGVLNVVTGPGHSTGEALITHSDVNKISFTGSTTVGKHVLETSARDLKRVTLELGGKSPFIVFEDADLDAAATAAAMGFCAGSGQGCVAGTRVLVQESVREEFTRLLREKMATIPMGDPFDAEVLMGPLASRGHYAKVTGYIDLARQSGGNIIGDTHEESDDLFVGPTLVTGLDNTSRIAQEEIFGPVAVLLPFQDVEEAVRIANDTVYGLAATVFTTDLSRAHTMADRLQAGTVWVNTVNQMSSGPLPFGGFKQSGIGREHGTDVIDAYTETKAIVINL
ncbi:aldehyde dehydrogenase family protein [Actinocorallia sp. A-T 12471]|uniref:aldehyde dehydrogenase family protein n=1 Tax=Actinocorallia sp. A-T 12471 TaxID=3089813 RepID=UPI0029D1E4DA|nr:aldehyde dehydrogenase family protein [Actinocorallia sp. A-T 12471]MDX6742459.1 aldehyde dehydrogenase family protein [Actinocorallia sp. A-T 12471]